MPAASPSSSTVEKLRSVAVSAPGLNARKPRAKPGPLPASGASRTPSPLNLERFYSKDGVSMTPTAQQIQKEGWQAYFDLLNKMYPGWAVTIELLLGEMGDQPAANGPPFQGISFESKGGSAAGDVLIEVGDIGTPYEVHRVNRPRIIQVS